MHEERAVISGSVSPNSHELRRSREADLDDTLDATVVIRRPVASAGMADDLLSGRAVAQSREEVEQSLAADPADLASVAAYLNQCGLNVSDRSAVTRTVKISGTIEQFEKAFGVELAYFARNGGAPFLSYAGPITVPCSIAPLIVAVLGLNQEPAAATR